MKFSLSNPFTEDLAVDLGTVHTFIYARGRGMVVNEPSLVASDTVSGEVVAVGNEALEMLGRSPEDVEVAYPMREGVVADSVLAQKLLARFIRKARGGRARFSRRLVLAVPSNITSVERLAVKDMVKGIGVSRVYLVEEGMAAAIGAKLPVSNGASSMVVDVGGGATSIAVLANSGIVESQTVRVGGLDMDYAIRDYIKHKYQVLIGERTAERVKMEIGCATKPIEERKSVVKGQSLTVAGPTVVDVTSFDVHQAIDVVVKRIVESVRDLLGAIPPEVASDVHDRGITLTGGIALLAGMDGRIAEGTKVGVNVAESPRQSVGRGALALFDQPLLLRRIARNVELG
ncbi:MAG TPA: rod shape-determining protein [Blastocatellia bacterium]|nr:rod shape-determining protein [Blastocatellia bacterium]